MRSRLLTSWRGPLLASVLGLPAIATAAPAPADTAASSQRGLRVRLVVAGPAAHVDAAREVLLELLGRVEPALVLEFVPGEELDLDEIVARRPDARDALAFVYVDLRRSERLVLIADGPYARILVRRLGSGEFDEAAREEIAAIVTAAVEALVDGAQIGIARPSQLEDPVVSPSKPPLASARAEPAPRAHRPVAHVHRRWTLALAGAYRVQALAPAAPLHALDLGVGTVSPSRVAFEAKAWAGALLPARPGEAAGVRIAGASARAQLGVRVRFTRRLSWLTAGGLGIAVLSVRVDDRPATVAAIPTAHWRAGLSLQLAPRWSLGLVGHADLDLVDTRVVARPSGRILFDPWRVWPGAALVIGFGVPARAPTRQ
ncbi:MAG: hypothetical protein IPK74_00735 [Deltaproteobacteria bacterium]|nr:hypothetical protein [Deltaproteobacteria bacterium]